MLFSFSALAALSALVAQVQAIPKVTRTGRYLYQEDGTRFYIKGIGYQRQGEVLESDDNHFNEPGTFIDPLADSDACRRDAANFQAASVNTLRVYSVDSTLDHDECMQVFSDAGIYLILDLSLPIVASIGRQDPSWSTNIMNTYLQTINVFEKYDNVIAYNVGNEVVDNNSTTLAALPYIKAAARDIKAYLKSINSDRLVGYASIDGDLDIRKAVADFLSCGSEATAIDIFGLNEYTWCGSGGSLENSRYRDDISQFADYNVVAYFSEYGCVTGGPRIWTEVEALFGEEMSEAWSGGIAFSYFPTAALEGEFGLVTLSADNRTVTPSSEFTELGAQYGAIDGPNSPARASAPASTYPTCAAITGASLTLPGTPNSQACSCLLSSLSCVVDPAVAGDAEVVGPLTGTACGLLSEAGGSCDDIGGSGVTGTYGRLAACGPDVKLSFAMSSFYELEGRNPEACGFGGNAIRNPSASIEAPVAASSCVASPSATILPLLPTASSTPGAGGNSGTGGNGGSAPNRNNGASVMTFGVAAMGLVGAVSAALTLL